MKKDLVKVLIILLAGAMLLPACAAQPPDKNDLTPLTVQLAWSHQAQFAGLYAADQQGYFAEEGIAVKFLPGGPDVDHLATVLSGATQFGVISAPHLVESRARGENLKALAVFYRRSSVVLITRQESGITRPQDMIGKIIRTGPNLTPHILATMSYAGLDPDQYQLVSLPSDVDMFASGEVPVWGAYLDGFALTVEKAGYAINKIFPDDYGVHFYGDTLYTTDALIEKDPDLVEGFTRAALKGWQYALEHPEEVGVMVAVYRPDIDVGLENERMMTMLPLIYTGEDEIGWMRAETWQGMLDMLSQQALLEAPVDVQDVYTLQFLEEIYP